MEPVGEDHGQLGSAPCPLETRRLRCHQPATVPTTGLATTGISSASGLATATEVAASSGVATASGLAAATEVAASGLAAASGVRRMT